MRSGNVERLGRRSHHHQSVFDPVDMRHGRVHRTGKCQVVVDFIADQNQAVPLGECGNGPQLPLGPNATTGIVR